MFEVKAVDLKRYIFSTHFLRTLNRFCENLNILFDCSFMKLMYASRCQYTFPQILKSHLSITVLPANPITHVQVDPWAMQTLYLRGNGEGEPTAP